MSTNTVTLPDGTNLNYCVEGKSDGDWIILSNSLATDLRLWDNEVKFLSKSMRVLRYDVRGHGQSESSPAPYDFDQLCADLVALMDHLSIEKADIMGISLGGMTALAMGIKHPTRVNRIMCCDARADAPDPYKAIWDGNIAKLHAENLGALCEPTLTRWFTAPFLQNADNKLGLDVVRSMFNATAPDGYEGVARCLQSLDLKGDLAGLSHETLYVTGAADMAAPVAVMQEMSDLTPNSQFKVIEDAAHLSNLEQPEEFANIIKKFLNIDG
ncbi:alpha/beta fold hydrolase [Pacificibacter sp. AS14]|uniref:alpha/beta fold hydrolase n=1 Tax=Pacificibacter sp. AS14 TaxID=3135785 RepID=UPI00317A9726